MHAYCPSQESSQMTVAFFLAGFVLWLPNVAMAQGATTMCITSHEPTGTTTAWRKGDTTVSITKNPTPYFAPCGTDWSITRETLTVLLPECDETQVRDEPRLTNGAEPPKPTCVLDTPSVILTIPTPGKPEVSPPSGTTTTPTPGKPEVSPPSSATTTPTPGKPEVSPPSSTTTTPGECTITATTVVTSCEPTIITSVSYVTVTATVSSPQVTVTTCGPCETDSVTA